jgi:hypothetical protein
MASFDFRLFKWSVSLWVRETKKIDPNVRHKHWFKDGYVVVDSVEMEIAVHHENNAMMFPYRNHVRGMGPTDCPGCLWMLSNIPADKYALGKPGWAGLPVEEA